MIREKKERKLRMIDLYKRYKEILTEVITIRYKTTNLFYISCQLA